MRGLEEYVKKTLVDPLEVRRSRRDPSVYMYYRPWWDKLICVVAKLLNDEGFIITAYPTRRMAPGDTVWQRQPSRRRG
jgi:hypothetical protein